MEVVPDDADVDVVGAFVVAGRVPDAAFEPDFELLHALSRQATATAASAGLRTDLNRGPSTG